MVAATVEELLQSRIGLDPASAGPGLVARAVRSRMSALGLAAEDSTGYLGLLEGSEREFDALVDEVVIPESWFLRDERPFSFLADRFAGRRDAPDRPPLRVLSIPCANGEEPYSVAISLLDRGWKADRFRVTGVDLSRKGLSAARAAIYAENSFRSKDLGFRARYFRPAGGGYVLEPRVKETVEFRRGNVADPGFLAGEPPYDAVLCRNLLIYLDEATRRRARGHLDRLLAPDGLIFLGHAENLGPLGRRFRTAGECYCFAFERAPEVADTVPDGTPVRSSVPATRPPSRPPARRQPVRTSPQAPRQVNVETSRPPSAAPTPSPPDLESLLGEAVRLADLGRHEEAASACEDAIRRGGPTPAALFLLGVVRQAAGRRDEAERCFEKAVYLDPSHDEALLALSAAARRRGDEAAAANYLRRAGRSSEFGTPR